jgi:hypothetical protein
LPSTSFQPLIASRCASEKAFGALGSGSGGGTSAVLLSVGWPARRASMIFCSVVRALSRSSDVCAALRQLD